MFVPSIARHFNLENKKVATDSSRIMIPLKGASLGNGWIEAKTQGPAVVDYSWYVFEKQWLICNGRCFVVLTRAFVYFIRMW